jgi:hypothetical protein
VELDQLRGPGRHVVRSPSPLDDAERLAADLRAEIVLPEDAPRTLQTVAALVGDGTSERLRALCAELERAERILARTEVRALDTFQDLASESMGLTLHPQTLRDAAEALRSARAAHRRAEADLEALEPEVDTDEAPAAAREVTPRDDEPSDQPTAGDRRDRRRARRRALIVVFVAIAAGVALAVAQVVPFWAPIPLVALALLYAWRTTRAAKSSDEGSDVASAHLAAVGAMTDQLYSGRLPSSINAIHAAHERRRHLLELERDTALERLRVAQRKWEDLAGTETDPADVEELLERRDPQRHRTAPWVAEAASVRAASSFHEATRDEWLQAWRAVGREAPPTADIDAAINEVEAKARLLVAAQRPIIAVAPPDDVLVESIAARLPVVVIVHDPHAEPAVSR